MIAEVLANENDYQKSQETFRAIVLWLRGQESHQLTHHAIEEQLTLDLRELGRLLYQAHLNDRGLGNVGPSLVGSDGNERSYIRPTSRQQESVFGRVQIERVAYQAPSVASICPKDAQLNLPPELYSHGLRKRVAKEAAKSSYDEVLDALDDSTAAHVPKRQAEELAVRAAQDFDAFYETRSSSIEEEPLCEEQLLIMTSDHKGVVVRHEDLRPATKKAAQKAAPKKGEARPIRLKKGQKRNRKRMAMVASVYSIAPHVRSAEQICKKLGPLQEVEKSKKPKPTQKRVWASIEKSSSEVVKEIFDEAQTRDPKGEKKRLVLIDGEENQKKLFKEEALKRELEVVMILDIIHVLGYLWNAAYVFKAAGSLDAQEWVSERLLRILQGKSSQVAGGIRRSATKRGVEGNCRKAVDKCCDYMLKNKELMRYDEYLKAGYPIATGVIEGACRHLVKDRMDRTGARWSLLGAEAVLRLRALVVSGDFEEYWSFHMCCEYQTHHGHSFQAAPKHESGLASQAKPPHLRVVK